LATAPARGCCRAPTGDPVVVSAQAIGVRSASASSLVANTGAAIGLRGAAVEEDRFVVGREVASQRRADRCAVWSRTRLPVRAGPGLRHQRVDDAGKAAAGAYRALPGR